MLIRAIKTEQKIRSTTSIQLPANQHKTHFIVSATCKENVSNISNNDNHNHLIHDSNNNFNHINQQQLPIVLTNVYPFITHGTNNIN